MTKKDYVLIAAAIKDSACVNADRTQDYSDGIRTQLHVTACKIAHSLEATNPLFDRTRFLAACGVQS
jgi:hypothetical protein